jgi:hypothetical protein
MLHPAEACTHAKAKKMIPAKILWLPSEPRIDGGIAAVWRHPEIAAHAFQPHWHCTKRDHRSRDRDKILPASIANRGHGRSKVNLTLHFSLDFVFESLYTTTNCNRMNVATQGRENRTMATKKATKKAAKKTSKKK